MIKLIPGDEEEGGGISVKSKYEYENLGKCKKEKPRRVHSFKVLDIGLGIVGRFEGEYEGGGS